MGVARGGMSHDREQLFAGLFCVVTGTFFQCSLPFPVFVYGTIVTCLRKLCDNPLLLKSTLFILKR